VSADLTVGTWAAVQDRPDGPSSSSSLVMENLAAFQTDPCASSWYGFIVRLGLLVHAWEVRGLLGDRDPFPGVTALALADAKLGRDAAAGREAD
jgi:hypothetical protein